MCLLPAMPFLGPIPTRVWFGLQTSEIGGRAFFFGELSISERERERDVTLNNE